MLLHECLINTYTEDTTHFIIHGKNIHFINDGEEGSYEFSQICVDDNKKSFK